MLFESDLKSQLALASSTAMSSVVYAVPSAWWKEASIIAEKTRSNTFPVLCNSSLMYQEITTPDDEARNELRNRMHSLKQSTQTIVSDKYSLLDSCKLGDDFVLIGAELYEAISNSMQLESNLRDIAVFTNGSSISNNNSLSFNSGNTNENNNSIKTEQINSCFDGQNMNQQLSSSSNCSFQVKSNSRVYLDSCIRMGIVLELEEQTFIEVGYYPRELSLSHILSTASQNLMPKDTSSFMIQLHPSSRQQSAIQQQLPPSKSIFWLCDPADKQSTESRIDGLGIKEDCIIHVMDSLKGIFTDSAPVFSAIEDNSPVLQSIKLDSTSFTNSLIDNNQNDNDMNNKRENFSGYSNSNNYESIPYTRMNSNPNNNQQLSQFGVSAIRTQGNTGQNLLRGRVAQENNSKENFDYSMSWNSRKQSEDETTDDFGSESHNYNNNRFDDFKDLEGEFAQYSSNNNHQNNRSNGNHGFSNEYARFPQSNTEKDTSVVFQLSCTDEIAKRVKESVTNILEKNSQHHQRRLGFYDSLSEPHYWPSEQSQRIVMRKLPLRTVISNLRAIERSCEQTIFESQITKGPKKVELFSTNFNGEIAARDPSDRRSSTSTSPEVDSFNNFNQNVFGIETCFDDDNFVDGDIDLGRFEEDEEFD